MQKLALHGPPPFFLASLNPTKPLSNLPRSAHCSFGRHQAHLTSGETEIEREMKKKGPRKEQSFFLSVTRHTCGESAMDRIGTRRGACVGTGFVRLRLLRLLSGRKRKREKVRAVGRGGGGGEGMRHGTHTACATLLLQWTARLRCRYETQNGKPAQRRIACR